ncbi:MAG: FkbM family methyltransferase, partial [Cyanobacteria bacterium P01_A01_bin.45]
MDVFTSRKSNDKLKIIKSLLSSVYYGYKNSFQVKSNECQYNKYQYLKLHSQFGEDRYIIENIKLPEKGVFIDVGAGHPIYLSNTYFFEQNGWNGICIDADIKQVELLKKVRKNVEWAAVVLEEGEIDFFQSLVSEFSTTSPRNEYQGIVKSQFKKDAVKVPAFRLETILEKYKIGIIDVLNIDVEGVELDVWQTFDYQK